MSVVTIQSEKFPDGFPEGTTILIEWVSRQVSMKRKPNVGDNAIIPKIYKDRRRVWKGAVTGTFTKNFDFGKYCWKAYMHDEAGIDGFRDWGEFLVGMDEEQWLRISHMEPKNQKPIMTTDGISYHCNFPGCRKLSTGKIAGLIHETSEHYGVDLLNVSSKREAEQVKSDVDKQIDEALHVKKRGPGRPPKIQ